MTDEEEDLTVYYDGACPSCVRDRAFYERLAARDGKPTEWVDITGREAELCELGIDPGHALRELHVRDAEGAVHRELDAYILLMKRLPRLRWLAWIIGLPVIRPCLSWLYRHWVRNRLEQQGRM